MRRLLAALFLLTLMLVFVGCSPSDMVGGNSSGQGGGVSNGGSSSDDSSSDPSDDPSSSGDESGDDSALDSVPDEENPDEMGEDDSALDSVPDEEFPDESLDDPGSDPALDDPGSDPALDDPGSDPALDDPGSDPALDDPGSDPALDDPGGDPAAPRPQRPARTTPKTYADMALVEFQDGHQQKAFEYLYAHVLHNDQAASNMKLHWFPAGKRPTIAVRWAVGITFTPARQYDGLPIEFGQPVSKLTGDPRRPNSIRLESGTRVKEPQNAEQAMKVFTGSFGEKMLQRISQGVKAGDFGDVLRIAPAVDPQANRHNQDFVGDPALDDPALEDPGLEDPGLDDPGLDDPGLDDPGDGGGGGSRTARRTGGVYAGYVGDTPSLVQGISFIGVGNREQLLDRVKRDRAEVLLVFEVSTLVTNSGLFNTMIEPKVYDAVKGVELFKGKEVNNLQLAFAKENPRQKNPVDEALEGFTRFVEEQIRVQPMPTLRPEHAVGRVDILVSTSHVKPLSTLAEVLYYYKQGLIDVEKLNEAYGKLIGPEDGKDLALGSPEERKAVLEGLLHGGAAGIKEGEKSAPPVFFGS
ncbi:MAG: hypothetical protein RIC55_01910 [Pirellulaceae bacterium]